MKIDLKKILWMIGLALVCYSATLSALLNRYLPAVLRYSLPLVSMVVFLLANRLRLKCNLPVYYLPWALFFLFAIVAILRHPTDNLMATLTMFLCIVMGFLLMQNIGWLGIARKLLACFTGIYVFFTYFFFFFPKAYPIMKKLYGYYPIGTLNGKAGYHAGLADHYSSNGIYISICLMLVAILWMTSENETQAERRKKSTLLILLVLTAVALLLTTKRGVLVWSLFAVVATYWIVNQKKLRSFLQLVAMAVGGYALLYFLMGMIPALSDVFERFSTMGKDGASLERLAMWQLALSMFGEYPVFGAGFWSFPQYYARRLFGIFNNDRRYKYNMAAHNVYFQVLGETGLVGFILYLSAVGLVLLETIRLVRKYFHAPNPEIRFAVTFSLCIQFFYLAYSLSGNCLYDIVFYFYGIALAMTTALNHYDRHNKRKAEEPAALQKTKKRKDGASKLRIRFVFGRRRV